MARLVPPHVQVRDLSEIEAHIAARLDEHISRPVDQTTTAMIAAQVNMETQRRVYLHEAMTQTFRPTPDRPDPAPFHRYIGNGDATTFNFQQITPLRPVEFDIDRDWQTIDGLDRHRYLTTGPPTTPLPTGPINGWDAITDVDDPLPRIYPEHPIGNTTVAGRFRRETEDTTPPIVRRTISRIEREARIRRAMPHNLRSQEEILRRRNFSIAKNSRAKRDRTGLLFKTLMLEFRGYTQGKHYRFDVTGSVGVWYVMNKPVLRVDLVNKIFIEVMIPIPNYSDPKPGALNLTRFLFRMLGLGAVRYKDQNIISTSVTQRKLKPGENWVFGPAEIRQYVLSREELAVLNPPLPL